MTSKVTELNISNADQCIALDCVGSVTVLCLHNRSSPPLPRKSQNVNEVYVNLRGMVVENSSQLPRPSGIVTILNTVGVVDT